MRERQSQRLRLVKATPFPMRNQMPGPAKPPPVPPKTKALTHLKLLRETNSLKTTTGPQAPPRVSKDSDSLDTDLSYQSPGSPPVPGHDPEVQENTPRENSQTPLHPATPPPIPPKKKTNTSFSSPARTSNVYNNVYCGECPKPLARDLKSVTDECHKSINHPSHSTDPSIRPSHTSSLINKQVPQTPPGDYSTPRPLRPPPPPPKNKSTASLCPVQLNRENPYTLNREKTCRADSQTSSVTASSHSENTSDSPVNIKTPAKDYLLPLPKSNPPPVPQRNRTLSSTQSQLYTPNSAQCRTTELQQSLTQGGDQPNTAPPLPPPPPFKPPPPPVCGTTSSPPPPVHRSASVQGPHPLYLEVLPSNLDTKPNRLNRAFSQPALPEYYHISPLPQDYYNTPLPQDYYNTLLPQDYQSIDEPQELDSVGRWLQTVEGGDGVYTQPNSLYSLSGVYTQPNSLYSLSPQEQHRQFCHLACQVRRGLAVFHCLLLQRRDRLRASITELQTIADNLEKTQKATKIMGITSGTTGAVGGVAAVVGIALAPMTMGVSLIATAVGTGVAVAGSGVGAGAALNKRKTTKVDRKRVEQVVQDYKAQITDLEHALNFLCKNMEELRCFSMAQFSSADPQAMHTAKLVHAVRQLSLTQADHCPLQAGCVSTGLLQGFTVGLDFYFSDKDGQKLKKGSEMKLANQIRAMAKQLQEGLDQINKAWEVISQAASIS